MFYPAKGGGKAEKKYLYKAGDECTALTGGWKAYSFGHSSDGAYSVSTSFTKESDHLVLPSAEYKILTVGPSKMIDLTNVDIIALEFDNISSDRDCPIIRLSTEDSGYAFGSLATGTVPHGLTGTGLKFANISEFVGKYYILSILQNGRKINLKNMWMK